MDWIKNQKESFFKEKKSKKNNKDFEIKDMVKLAGVGIIASAAIGALND